MAVGELRDAGVRAARLPFRGVPPFAWLWDDLLSELEARRVPCFCDFGAVSTLGELTDADVAGLREIAAWHPHPPLVVSHVMGGLGVQPAVPHRVRQLRNLRLDVSGILDSARQRPGGWPGEGALCQRGALRGPRAARRHGAVRPRARRCGEEAHLRGQFQSSPGGDRMTGRTGTLLATWREGRWLPGVLVSDGDIHLGEWPSHETFATEEEVPEQSVRAMDANCVDAICVVGGGHMQGEGDPRIGNDRLLKWWKALPNRIIPFFHVNPNDAKQRVMGECEKMPHHGMREIKPIDAYQEAYPGDGPSLVAVYEFAARNSTMPFNHHWSYAELDTLAPMFPDTPFIGAPGAHPALLRKHPNVYASM